MNENTTDTPPLAVGTIVRSDRLHAIPFGTIEDIRKQFRTGQGWGRVEYLVSHRVSTWKSSTWIDEHQVEVATLDDVLTHYDSLIREQDEHVKKLRDMIGKRVPKYNPERHLGSLAEHLTDAFRHEDGSITYVFHDPEPGDTESPRTYDGNVATLIQENSWCIDLDDDDAGLREAHDHFYGQGRHTTTLMRRYLEIFRPEILHYEEHWSVGQSGSYGWGYVTRDAMHQAGLSANPVDAQEAFDQEVKVFGQWAEGEVYGSCHIAERRSKPDCVFGHLGYTDSRAIAAYHTESPILEVLY